MSLHAAGVPCRFFASEEYKTGKPPDGKVFGSPPFELDTATSLEAPINFRSVSSWGMTRGNT